MCPAMPAAAEVKANDNPRSMQMYAVMIPENPLIDHSPTNSIIENGVLSLLRLLM
jgi:hypothetical protein